MIARHYKGTGSAIPWILDRWEELLLLLMVVPKDTVQEKVPARNPAPPPSAVLSDLHGFGQDFRRL
jgi:hypothetical protein